LFVSQDATTLASGWFLLVGSSAEQQVGLASF